MAQKEGAFVELLASKPCRDLAVVFARVARPASGHHVLQGVATTARNWLNAVALHRNIRG